MFPRAEIPQTDGKQPLSWPFMQCIAKAFRTVRAASIRKLGMIYVGHLSNQDQPP